jgi:prepilin-type N-terminal cleavage/methylation domain-containing protein
MRLKQAGFTLIELSIVIVIIGLIVAGVVGGQQLVNQAKLRQLITTIDKYQTAFLSFKLQYNALAGDFSSASSYWSGAPNGNGDGKFDGIHIDTSVTEVYGAYKHLANAGLMKNNLTGLKGSGPVIGENVPELSYNSSLMTLWFHTANFYPMMPGYESVERIVLSGLDDDYNNPQILTRDALNIDSKIDDGRPLVGKVTAWNNYDYEKCTTLTHQQYPVTQTVIDEDYAPAKYSVDEAEGKCTIQVMLSVQ